MCVVEGCVTLCNVLFNMILGLSLIMFASGNEVGGILRNTDLLREMLPENFHCFADTLDAISEVLILVL